METTKSRIPLTKNMDLAEGSHVLYFYTSEECYMDNIVSFVLSAKQ